MKTLWTALSTVAVANLIALAGFIAWLGLTDRIDTARLGRAREVLAETVTAERARLEKEQAAAAAEAAIVPAALEQPSAPVTAADRLSVKIDQSKIDEENAAALRREIEILRATLERQIRELADARAALEAERAEFLAMRDRLAAIEGSGQFKKTLDTYSSLKADKAKAALAELLKQSQAEQVVSYLSAMEDRTRTKIIDEFIKEDPKLAADLLESLRTRGQLSARP